MEYKINEFQDREYKLKDAVRDRAIHAMIAKLVLAITFVTCLRIIFF